MPACAQEGFVYGRVVLVNHAPPESCSDYFVDVIVKDGATRKDENSVRTQNDIFGLRISPEPHDVLICSASAGYVPDRRHRPIGRKGDLAIFPPIRLSRPLLLGKNITPGSISDELRQQADIFEEMDRLDLLQWNLAEYHVAYRDNQGLLAAITQFEDAHRSDRFMAAEHFRNQPIFRQMIAFQGGQKVVIAARPLLDLMLATNITAGIRASAIRTLSLQTAIEPKLLSEFVAFLHEHAANPTDRLYRPARSALARVGSKADKEQVIKDTASPDPDVAVSAQVAMKEANLADPERNESVSIGARAALGLQDRTLQAPFALETWTVWAGGNLAPGLTMRAFTNIDTPDKKDWFSVAELSGEKLLRVDFPKGQVYGILQFTVEQKGPQTATINLSRFTELVVELRSEDENRNFDLGIKQLKPFDPEGQTKFKRTFTDISTGWQSYRMSLRGEAAQLSAHADDRQYQRLSRLEVVAELSFGDTPKQTFFIRKIYFSR